MAAVVEGRLGFSVPAYATQPLSLLRVFPMRHALAKLLVLFPPTHVRVACRGFNECARTMLLVVDPVAIIRVAILEGIETMTVPLGEAERAAVGRARVVDASSMAVAVAVLDLALVVLSREVGVREVAVEPVWEVAGKCTICKIGLRICKGC